MLIKKFDILGQQFKVKYPKNVSKTYQKLTGRREKVFGFCDLAINVVYIDANLSYENYDQFLLTLTHEITHCILNSIGEHRLNNNEKFVDLVSNCVCQIFKTMK